MRDKPGEEEADRSEEEEEEEVEVDPTADGSEIAVKTRGLVKGLAAEEEEVAVAGDGDPPWMAAEEVVVSQTSETVEMRP